MKVLQGGVVKTEEKENEHFWWEEEEFICPECSVIIRLEHSDWKEVKGDSVRKLLIDCPFCHSFQWFEHYSAWWRKLWRRFQAWNREDIANESH